MEIFIFTLCNFIFFTNFIELVFKWRDREKEVNKIRFDHQKSSISEFYFNFSKSFSITSFCFFLILKIVFEMILVIFSEGNTFFIIQAIFSSGLVVIFIIQLITYIFISIFISHSKKIFEKEIMIQIDLTILQTFLEVLKFILIINSAVFIVFFSINFFMASFVFQVIVRNICFILYVFLAICLILYKTLSFFFGIRYDKKAYNHEDFFVLSNIANNFYKGFLVLKLEEVNVDEISHINYKILKFLKYMTMEIKYDHGHVDILFWIYADSRKISELYGMLRTFADEFSSLFPAAHYTRVLNPEEVGELINKDDVHLLKTEKKASIDFLNIESQINKTDLLLKSITTFDRLEFSIVFNYNLRDLPKKIFKKSIPSQTRYNHRRGNDDVSIYNEVESFDVINRRRMDLETNNYMNSIITGAFDFDLYVFIKNGELLDNSFEREKIFQSFKTLIFNIYNITLKKPNRFEKLFSINYNRIRFRLKLFKKIFFISGNYIKHILRFPLAEHIDLKTTKNYNFSFPEPSKQGDKKIVLGKLIEHKEERDWEFPLNELSRSMTVIGIPGMGKTTFALNLLKEIRKHGIPFIVFDKKNDYSKIYNEDTLFLRPGRNFFINIFDFNDSVEPGIHSEYLFNMILELLPQRDELSPAAQNLLLVSLEKTCEDKNRRNKERFLETIDEVAKDIISQRNRDDIVGALKVRLAPLLRGSMGRVIEKSDIGIYEIFNRDTIIDLNYFENQLGAGVSQVRFLVKMIIRYLVYNNISRAYQGNIGVQHATVIDDASSYFNKTPEGEESYLKILIQLCRKMGEFLLVLDQSTTGLDPEVIDYPNTYVAMNHSDRLRISMSKLGLRTDQSEIITSLEKYTAIVKSNQSTSPFLINTIRSYLSQKYSNKEMEFNTNIKISNFTQSKSIDSVVKEAQYIDKREKIIYGNITELRKKQIEKRKRLIDRYNQDIIKNDPNAEKIKTTNKFDRYSIEEISQNPQIIQLLEENLKRKHMFYTEENLLQVIEGLKDQYNFLENVNSLDKVRELMDYLAAEEVFSIDKISILQDSYRILIPNELKWIYRICKEKSLLISDIDSQFRTIEDRLSYNRAVLLYYIKKFGGKSKLKQVNWG